MTEENSRAAPAIFAGRLGKPEDQQVGRFFGQFRADWITVRPFGPGRFC